MGRLIRANLTAPWVASIKMAAVRIGYRVNKGRLSLVRNYN